MKRRGFIKAASLSTASLVVSGCLKDDHHIKESRFYTPNLIVGSGFGGSVTALRLSQAGQRNILIERGRSWSQHDFCSFTDIDHRSTWLNSNVLIPIVNIRLPVRKYVGVIEYHTSPNMNIFNAAGLGGGSLVFGATYVKPDKQVFQRVFPSEVDYDEMDLKYYSKVEQEIGVSEVPEDIYNSEYYLYARSFKQQIDKAGLPNRRMRASYDWNVIRKEMVGEIPLDFLKGDGNYGTRNGSKFSLDKTYIPKAVATGNTEVHTHTDVQHISYTSDRKFEVHTRKITDSGQVLAHNVYVADKLFLCAGAPNTIKLLLKSKAISNLGNISSEVGKGFGTNGKTFFRRTIAEDSGGLTGWTPAESSPYYDNPHVPILIESIPQPIGLIIPIPELKSNFHVGLGATTYRGSHSYDADSDKLILDWSKDGLNESIEAARHWCERVNAANPDSYVDNGLIRNQFANNVSYHPLGGCVIGKATDMYGRLEGYDNLYVNDSTLIPGVAASSNPAFTIAALAERNIEKIIQLDF